MFKRRKELAWYEKLREWVWPRAGWPRAARYIGHRVRRMPDTPYRIAAGLACGTAISFTPFMGFHLILAMALAFALRANMLASAIGTLVGNPWTFPFIWVLVYRAGTLLLGTEAVPPLGDRIDTSRLFLEPWTTLQPVLAPMLAGGLPIAILVWFLTYWPVVDLVRRYQARRARKFEALRDKETGAGAGAGED